MLEKKPFVRYNEEKTRDIVPVALNVLEREELNACKKVLNQEKDSTALKQLARIGAKVLQEEKTDYIIRAIYDNKRKNKRLGINEF